MRQNADDSVEKGRNTSWRPRAQAVRAWAPLQWKSARGGGQNVTGHEPEVVGTKSYVINKLMYKGTLNTRNSGQSPRAMGLSVQTGGAGDSQLSQGIWVPVSHPVRVCSAVTTNGGSHHGSNQACLS